MPNIPWYVPILSLVFALSVFGAWIVWVGKKMGKVRKNNNLKKD